MSKLPQLLRRPLPPKDAIPLSPPQFFESRSRFPDKISTKDESGPDSEHKKEHDSTKQPEIKDLAITSWISSPNGFPSHCFIVHRQDDPNFAEDDLWYYIPPKFTLDSFLQKPSASPSPSDDKRIVLSHYNYNKIVKLLASELWNQNQEKVNIIELSIDDIPAVSRRIPQRQLILEMIAAARNQENYFRYGASPQLPDHPGAVLNIERRTKFLESPDIKSPIMEEEQEGKINPYELFILRSLALGGDSLNLRIYGFFRLEVLNLRDNPITEISSDIAKLTNLRIFNISFCMVSILPVGLFLLPHLQTLNVAYNKISFIPNDIRNLRALQFLNVEGNELISLPCGLLQLHLKNVRVDNNYMHPLFWGENARNQPQRLTDLTALTFSKNHLNQWYTNIPKEVQHILNNATTCDCCKGPLYGPGLRLIRPCRRIFNIESLPFLFHACSPFCYKWFMSKTH
ncbi:uncharacterized protein [Heptranchias perlo]|uniref:uncharacterized protein isoform X2 n=1 Tax=Heptranchias perlo TaxID=212740 RepID=UPI00355A9427